MVMRNRILAITRGSIPYVPELRQIAGSATSTILMQQLDYWFERYPEGFYKFQGPSPDHPAYRAGDSWMEELEFSVAELRTAFDQIGHRHKSKSAWSESLDPFEGKFYCCYTDRRTQLTYYFRNHSKVDAALDTLIAKRSMAPVPAAAKAPIHAKSTPKPPEMPANRAVFAGYADSAFTGNAESQFPVNSKGQHPANEDQSFPANHPPASTGSNDTPLPQPHNGNSQEPQDVNTVYTETTGLQRTTQKPPPQQPEPTVDEPHAAANSPSRSGSDGLCDLESLVFPQAAAAELDVLRVLVAQCKPENRQALLDEVEGARLQKTLRVGIVPFARALLKADAVGAFVPSVGIAVQVAREQALQHSRNLAASHQTVHQDTVSEEIHQWTAEELQLLPPAMRQSILNKLGQGKIAHTGVTH